jgi:hypothetical protein
MLFTFTCSSTNLVDTRNNGSLGQSLGHKKNKWFFSRLMVHKMWLLWQVLCQLLNKERNYMIPWLRLMLISKFSSQLFAI